MGFTEDKAVIESEANFYGLGGTRKRFPPVADILSGQRATIKKRKAAKANSCSLF
ncbi:MAG: hypothetical protein JKX84_04780 [Flavobacteriales bacterium]|nr:hypothetical protein [Flavobacteriales bacterium]